MTNGDGFSAGTFDRIDEILQAAVRSLTRRPFWVAVQEMIRSIADRVG